MRTWKSRVIAAVAAVAACGGARGDEASDLARAARGVLKVHCHRCHHGVGSQGGDFDVLKASDLLKKWELDAELVVPGKPDGSLLYDRAAVTKDMPPRNIKERPSESDAAALKAWIAAGAPAFPDESASRPNVGIASVLKSARDHLRDADPEDRRYLRFFTLHTMANNPAVSDEDLRLARAALSKALNSLSRKPEIVVPTAVDAAKTVYVVDVRDLDWDRRQLWGELERAYPYGLEFREEALRKVQRDLTELAACDIPILRADWFIATATRPPLYHVMLQLPKTSAELERELGVDIAGSFLNPRPERIARAGFVKSGVSGQNRMVERNEARRGSYYWPSYDFKESNGRSKLTRFPLGPLNLFPEGRHPFPNQAFVHDGGEIIFGLENGLQAYLLINGQGQRIDAGPIEVVSDETKTSGTNLIVTGLSCMACHKHGLLPLNDTIRTSNALFGEAEEQVGKLYVEKAAMDRLVKRDSERFLAALEKTIGPFVREGADRDKPLREFREPVAVIAQFYRLNHLDLRAVASELDVEDAQAIKDQVGVTKLKRLGLDGLLKGDVVSRAEWEAASGLSLMQELARELNRTPLLVR